MTQDFFFFLSYARDDAEGEPLIDEFYEDLRREIRRQVGLVKEDVIGFRDTRIINLGSDWSTEVAQALQSSKTLLCLYSPTYFNRPQCGREVQVFRLRQQSLEQRKASASVPSVILPVIWVPCEHLIPRTMLDLQYDQGDFPESYRRLGLRQLKSLARLRDDYQLFLRDLASKTITTATTYNLPSLADPPLLSTISSAFEEPAGAAVSGPKARLAAAQRGRQSERVQQGPYNLTYVVRDVNVPPEEDALVQALVEVSSTGEALNARLRCHLTLLLDISGSMNSPQKYPLVLEATKELLQNLPKEDLVTLILFSTRADVVLAAGPVGEIDADNVLHRIENSGVKFGNSTQISGALTRALEGMRNVRPRAPDVAQRLYVLTDGQLHDLDAALAYTQRLQALGVEAHAYGFGEDWSLSNLRALTSAVSSTGTVKPIPNTRDVNRVFGRISTVTSSISASDAELRLLFSPEVVGGDIFRVRPGEHYFGRELYFSDREAVVPIGILERDRSYQFAIEARVLPTRKTTTHLCDLNLRYRAGGKGWTLPREVEVARSPGSRLSEEIEPSVTRVFTILERLRSKDPKVLLDSLRARHELAILEHRDTRVIRALKTAISELEKGGTLDYIEDFDRDLIEADNLTREGFPIEEEHVRELYRRYPQPEEFEEAIRRYQEEAEFREAIRSYADANR